MVASSVKKGMAQASIKRMVLGCSLIAGGIFALLLVYYGKPDLHPTINLLTVVMLLGLGVTLPSFGIFLIVKALTSFHFKPPSTPEDVITKFMQ